MIKVVIDSMAGYAFAKMTFPGRDALFLLVLLTLMIPFAATLIPLYMIVRDLHLTQHLLGSDPAAAGQPDRHLHDAPVHRVAAERSGERGATRRLLRVPDLPPRHPAADPTGTGRPRRLHLHDPVDELPLAAGRSAPRGDAHADRRHRRACDPSSPSTGASSRPAPCSRCCRWSSSSSSCSATSSPARSRARSRSESAVVSRQRQPQ